MSGPRGLEAVKFVRHTAGAVCTCWLRMSLLPCDITSTDSGGICQPVVQIIRSPSTLFQGGSCSSQKSCLWVECLFRGDGSPQVPRMEMRNPGAAWTVSLGEVSFACSTQGAVDQPPGELLCRTL